MTDSTLTAIGTTALRVGVGATLIAHGAQKLFGSFGGGGPAGTGAFFESVGFRPGKANAIAAGVCEAGGGALITLGLATPAAGAAVAGTMVVASTMHTDNGFFVTEGGFEYPAVLGLLGASFTATGAGPVSLDAALGGALDRPWMRIAALASIIPAAAAVIARRRAALAQAPQTASEGEEPQGTAPGAAS